MDRIVDREEAEVRQRKVPWQEAFIRSVLILEPLLDHPELFRKGKAREDELRGVLEKDHPEIVESMIERSRRTSEDDATNPYRINILASLYMPTLQILWPPKAEPTPELEEFRSFCDGWITKHLTPEEYQTLLHRMIGVKAIMDVKKKFYEGERPKIKRREAQRVFDLAKIALAIIDEYMGRPIDEEEVEKLIDRCKKRLSGERKVIFHEKFQELWKRAVAIKSGALKPDQN